MWTFKGMTRDQKLHRQHLSQRKGSNGKRQIINFVWEKNLYLKPEGSQTFARMIELWIGLYFSWENINDIMNSRDCTSRKTESPYSLMKIQKLSRNGNMNLGLIEMLVFVVMVVVVMMMMMMMMIIIIIIIIIISVNCNWFVTRWQWWFYMCTKYEAGC